ncbi:MAG: hypothetical protein LWX83_07865 [Anaerolineae bacterium]|nr:hypothetical protein [Anaerolineae bacterium]
MSLNKSLSARRILLFSLVLMIGLCMGFAVQRAWVGDDAYISFRTIDNLVNGYRLTWNTSERVQAFTHPLWLFFLTPIYFFTREVYLTVIGVSLLCTLAALIGLVLQTRQKISALFAVMLLGLSSAFIDYATSGLENPMSYLLIVLFGWVYWKQNWSPKQLFLLSLITSLAICNRMDSALVFAPALLYAWIKSEQKLKSLLWVVLGQAPFILWEIFSVVYFGFLFPNTAYAKLNNQAPDLEVIQQGIYYVINVLQRDPLTLLSILVLLVLIFAAPKTQRWQALMLFAGALLYILYTIKIGGDFMSGRFFTIPLMVTVVAIAHLDLSSLKPWGLMAAAGLIMAVGLFSPNPTWRMTPLNLPTSDKTGIEDERMSYFGGMGLFRDYQFHRDGEHEWKTMGEQIRQNDPYEVTPFGAVGLLGYYAGPHAYIVDELALADALLARIPPVRQTNWTMGHFRRDLPGGYFFSLESNEFQITDTDLAEYNRQLTLITSGPLFSRERWAAIWLMNTGQLDDLIHVEDFRFPRSQTVSIKTLDDSIETAAAWNDNRNITMGDQGLRVNLDGEKITSKMDVLISANDHYQIIFYAGYEELASMIVAGDKRDNGMALRTLEVPAAAVQGDCDHIRFMPVRTDGKLTLDIIRGDEEYSLGYVRFK